MMMEQNSIGKYYCQE